MFLVKTGLIGATHSPAQSSGHEEVAHTDTLKHSLFISQMITCKSSTSSFGTHALQRTVKTSARFVGLLEFQPSPSSQRNRKCVAVSSSFGRPQWSRSRRNLPNTNNTNSNADDVLGDEKGEKKVHCEVEVLSWRERRIKAEISVNADIESVWNALTDYERLADFIPNLVCR
jgi:hypothetical protein